MCIADSVILTRSISVFTAVLLLAEYLVLLYFKYFRDGSVLLVLPGTGNISSGWYCECWYFELYRFGPTIGHLTVGDYVVTGVPLLLFAFLVSSWKMNRKAEGRWLGTSPCDNERTIPLRKSALRAYERGSSELIPRGPRSRVGTYPRSKTVIDSSAPVYQQ